ncbi:TPA: hypothetical protein ACH3X1_016817 [Trebouxia sp. C0004]
MLIQEHHAHKRLTHITDTDMFIHLSVCDECVSVYLNPCPPMGAASHAGSDRPLDSHSVEPAAVLAALQFELCELPLAALSHPERQHHPVSQNSVADKHI